MPSRTPEEWQRFYLANDDLGNFAESVRNECIEECAALVRETAYAYCGCKDEHPTNEHTKSCLAEVIAQRIEHAKPHA